MSYNTKNYTEQGGDVTHIGGSLIFDEGASVSGGLIEHQADSTAEDAAGLREDFNALLAKLIAAGLMAEAETETETESETEDDPGSGENSEAE